MENERAAAFAWLMENPTGRALTAPNELDSVLNMYAAQLAYPNGHLERGNFLSERSTLPNGTETRHIGYHGYTFM